MKIKNKKESFMQGILAIMFSQVLIKILGLAYKVYLTNRDGFGDAGNAIYNAGFQIYALLLTISSIGVPGAISKLVSEKFAIGNYKGAHRIFKTALLIFSLVGFAGTSILFLGAKYISLEVLQIPEAEYTLIALSPSIFFVAISSVIRGYFNGMQNLRITARSQTIEQLFKTIFTIVIVEIIAIISGLDTTLMAAGANLATTLAVLLSFVYLYRYYNLKKKIIWKEIQLCNRNFKINAKKNELIQILSVSVPMSLSSIISAINRTIDGITVVRGLKTFMSEAAAKIQFGILTGKVDVLIGLPLSFNVAFATALVPAVSSAIAIGDNTIIKRRVSFSLLVTVLIGLPCTIGLCVFSDQILRLLFPNASDGGLILKIAAFTIIFTIMTQTVNGVLQGLGKLMVPAIGLTAGVIVKFILNIILVPNENIGILGAAFSSVVCHIISFIIGFSVLRKNMELDLGFNKFILKPIFATIIMFVCSYYIYLKLIVVLPESICTIIALLLAVLIYVFLLFILKIFNKNDIYMLPFGEKIYIVLTKLRIYK